MMYSDKDGMHKYYVMPEGTLVKDYKPTYKSIEVCQMGMPIGIYKLKTCLERFGDRELFSVMDFHDTRTTSYMIGRKVHESWRIL